MSLRQTSTYHGNSGSFASARSPARQPRHIILYYAADGDLALRLRRGILTSENWYRLAVVAANDPHDCQVLILKLGRMEYYSRWYSNSGVSPTLPTRGGCPARRGLPTPRPGFAGTEENIDSLLVPARIWKQKFLDLECRLRPWFTA